MKMFKKMAVLAAALMLLSVFVSCDNNAEESDAAVVAEFNGYGLLVSSINEFSERSAKKIREPDAKVTFYDDDTFKVVAFYQEKIAYDNIDLRAADKSIEVANGTYDGDHTKDGNVKITFENYADMETGELEEVPSKDAKTDITIKDGCFKFMYYIFERVEE